MKKEDRIRLITQLVDEVTREPMDIEKTRALASELAIPYSEDPMQFLNNVLKGIHFEEPKNESTI